MSDKRQLGQLEQMVKNSALEFRKLLEKVNTSPDGLTKEQYCRFLNMQYHLTKGVQRPFLTCASHSDLAHRKDLRAFLVNFANEEELHFKIAEKDLENLGQKPTSVAPLDVQLWWAYFESFLITKPFVRLGAACVLENMSSESGDVLNALFSKAKYMSPKNTKFIEIHRHEELPHGDEIMNALDRADLTNDHVDDLCQGAESAKVLYFRMMYWVLSGELR